ncbi:hypothetical protein [Actinoplanes sp. URMC 104]|uniref:hypothetical protein n=1 Tax=Actinoplanes sp. URMC 104 TaxID=3423409 RepID=UPI003F1C8700
MAERIEHHFNRRYHAARRDIYLIRTETGWQVVGRIGGVDGKEAAHYYDDEADARRMVERMRRTAPPGEDNWALMPQPPSR